MVKARTIVNMWWSLDINIKAALAVWELYVPKIRKNGEKNKIGVRGVSPRLWSRTTPHRRKYEAFLLFFFPSFCVYVPFWGSRVSPTWGRRESALGLSFFLTFFFLNTWSFFPFPPAILFLCPFPTDTRRIISFIEKKTNEELAIFSLDVATKNIHTKWKKFQNLKMEI